MNKLLEKTEIKLIHRGGGVCTKIGMLLKMYQIGLTKNYIMDISIQTRQIAETNGVNEKMCTDMLNGHREVHIIRYQIFTGSLREVAHWHFQMDVS